MPILYSLYCILHIIYYKTLAKICYSSTVESYKKNWGIFFVKNKKDFHHSLGHQWSSSHTCPRCHLKQINTFKKLLLFFEQKQNFIPIILLIYSRVVCNKIVTYFYLSYNYLLSFKNILTKQEVKINFLILQQKLLRAKIKCKVIFNYSFDFFCIIHIYESVLFCQCFQVSFPLSPEE